MSVKSVNTFAKFRLELCEIHQKYTQQLFLCTCGCSNNMQSLTQSSQRVNKRSLTSFIVFVVCARRLHGDTAARAPPSSFALAVPAVLTQQTLSISITSVRTAICKSQREKEDGLRKAEIHHGI